MIYAPRLVAIDETEFGSVLTLSDDTKVRVNVGPDRLDRALKECQRRPLAEQLATRSLGVLADEWRTKDSDWARISELVRASQIAAAEFGDLPGVWGVFGQPAAIVRELPLRVYGGLDTILYAFHPFQFLEDPNRAAPWCFATLNASCGRVFNVWVQRDSGRIEITSGVLPGHCVE